MFSGDAFVSGLLAGFLVFGGTVGAFNMALSWAARLGGRRSESDGWDGR